MTRSPHSKGEKYVVTEDTEAAVGATVDGLAAVFCLDQVPGFGPQKFKQLHEAGLDARQVLETSSLLPAIGKTGDNLRRAIDQLGEAERTKQRANAVLAIGRAHQHGAMILGYGHPAYPKNVFESNNPVPVLYARGALGVLKTRRVVACVGSRDIRQPYEGLHRAFASYAAELGFAVASGFATGADTVGHEAAFKVGGATICVMPSGLDRPFPPENRGLWDALLDYGGAVMVSEFPFGTGASGLTLRKRNKLIVAFALGVMLSQSSEKGGAMNAYRFALEQKKPIATFAGDDSPATSGNEAISRDRIGSVTTFPATGEAHEDWGEWLRKLSSSI